MSEDTDTLNSQIDPALVEQAMALIKSSQRIALLAHESPDGDCIGSALGMAHILRQLGKDCVPACADAAPQNLSFLPGIEMLQQSLSDEFFDLVIALDAGELPRFGPLYERHRAFLDRATILNIDHHISSSGCGCVNIIDPLSAATAELLVLPEIEVGLRRAAESDANVWIVRGGLAVLCDGDLVIAGRQAGVQILAVSIGLDFEVLSDALTIDRNRSAHQRLAVSIEDGPLDIPSLGKAGHSEQHRCEEEKQDFGDKFH